MSHSSVVNTAFIGTGNIARVHLDAIKDLKCASIVGVFDRSAEASESMAKAAGCESFTDLDRMLADPRIDIVHVLTPPGTHADLARRVVETGKHVFVEKPVTTNGAEADALVQLASAGPAVVGVNHNFVHHPAFAKLWDIVRAGRIGRLRYVDVTFHPMLKQLAAGQFSHWMFASPVNLLLEQAVHPLSQVLALTGDIGDMTVLPGPLKRLSGTASFVPEFIASMQCASVQASFRFMVGASYPMWRLTAVCDDGYAVADMIAGVCEVQQRSRFLDPLDHALSLSASAGRRTASAVRNLVTYGASQLGLVRRSDAFYLSMRGSIAEFYGSLAHRRPPMSDARFGAVLVKTCEQIAALAGSMPPATQSTGQPHTQTPAPASAAVEQSGQVSAQSGALVTLLGGTGFIGRATLDALLHAGYRVRVLARGVGNLHDAYRQPGVEVMSGDVRSRTDLDRSMQGATYVANLAHGGGGATFEQVRRSMVESAVAVAVCAHAARVSRVVHVGSIAGLYLGDPNEVIRGDTPPDPQPHKRGDYAHAKALADIEFERTCKARELSFVILRPGVVVGPGTAAFHSGLGFFNNDQHVIGWSDGRHVLPFVLVEDVASAIVAALTSSSADGKSYNLSGDVLMNAREFVDELARATGRPLRFHATSPRRLWIEDLVKAGIKRVGGRKVPMPSIRDFRSRAMFASFDCSDAKRDLGWQPQADRRRFIERAIQVHAI